MPGETLDLGNRYRLIRPLGTGGMGEVYLVEEVATGAQRALKVLAASLFEGAQGPSLVAAFKQEYRTMSRLRHPNTCEVFDYGSLPDGRPYMTMEYISGHALHDDIPLAPETFWPILQQLGAALAYIHREGFVHLDLKPENIRIQPDGSVKLMDFGLMSVSGQALPAVRGTLPYLSPEVARLDRVDARADIYSLGALIFHALAGAPPFVAQTALDYLRAHLQQQPPSLLDPLPGCSPMQAHTVARMLAKDPAARYPSVNAALQDLGLSVSSQADNALLSPSFSGRHAETAILTRQLEQLAGGQDAQLLILGPAGSGKTRLLTELQVQARLDEVPWLSAIAPESPSPYAPFIQILQALVPQLSEHHSTLWARHLSALGLLLPEVAADGPPNTLEPEAAKAATQAAICAMLRGMAATRGAVLVIEHIDRLDPLSTEVLTRLRTENAHAPMLILGTARTPLSDWPQVLELSNLEAVESDHLVASMLGLETPPLEFTRALYHLTQGNPGFTCVLLAHLLETGDLRREGSDWRLPATLEPATLPSDVADALLLRLGQLSSAARAIVEFAAIHMQPFDVLDARDMVGLTEDTFFDALESLLRAQVLERRGSELALTSTGLRQAVYTRLPEAVRREKHLALAQHLARRHGGAEFPHFAHGEPSLGMITHIAQQFLRSETLDETLDWLLLATERNLKAFAQDATETLIQEGLALLDRHPGHPRGAEGRIDLCNFGATVCHWRVQMPKAAHYLETAQALLAERADDKRLLEHLVTQGKYHSLTGDARTAGQYQRQAAELADRIGALQTGARARVNLGRAMFFQGNLAEAERVFHEVIEGPSAPGLTSWRALALSFAGYIRAVRRPAERSQGLDELMSAAQLQSSMGDRGGALYSLNLLYELQMLQGAFSAAEQGSRQGIELAQELGSTDDYVTALVNHTIACAELGDWETAEQSGDRCLHHARAAAHRMVLPIILAFMGSLHVLRGRPSQGLAQCTEAEQMPGVAGDYVQSLVALYHIQALLNAGLLPDAAAYAQRVGHVFPPEDASENTIRWQIALARLKLELDAAEESLSLSRSSIQAAEHLGAPALELAATCNQALALSRLERHAEASDAAHRTQTLAAGLQSAWWHLQAHLVLGECLAAKEPALALRNYQLALEEAQRQKLPLLTAQALAGIAQLAPSAPLLSQAQALLQGFAQELSLEQATVFKRAARHQRILAQTRPAGSQAAPENSEETFGQLVTINQELKKVAQQYERLFDEWTRQSRQLEQLNAFARQISHSLHLNTVLEQAILLTLEVTGAERGLVFLLDEAAASPPRLVAAFNAQGEPITDAEYSHSAIARAIESGRMVTVSDIAVHDDLAAQASVHALNLRSLMGVPLTSKQQTLGVLYVDSQATLRLFDDSDLEVLVAVAGHAAVAIRNALLYEATAQRAIDLERAIEQHRTVNFEASTDELTGLRNRRFFQEQVEQEMQISLRYARPLSILMLDVDHFKRFNDIHGHATGDEVLRLVAHVLASSSRGSDLPARWGGEEFIVMCPDTPTAGAVELAERIRQRVNDLQFFAPGDEPLPRISVSVGVATHRPEHPSFEALVAEADQALYRAKSQGRNRVCRALMTTETSA